MTLIKRLFFNSLLGAAAVLCAQDASATAERDVDDPSPDHQFAFLRIHQSDPEPHRTCDLIVKETGKILLRVAQSDADSDRLGSEVLWSPDSKRFALFTTYNHFGAELAVYLRSGDTFRKVTLPDIDAPDFPERLKRGHEWKWTGINSASAKRWRGNGTLVVRTESTLHAINSSLVLTSRRTTLLGFNKSGRATILKSNQKVSAHDDGD